MVKGSANPLSAAQFEIMEIVWARGETTVSQVLNAINEKRLKKLRRTTIQVQMNRLEKKGWLAHRTEGRTYYYHALMNREKAMAAIAGDVTNRIFGGSCAELVKCLFKQKQITEEEMQRIRQVLDQGEGE